MNNNEKKAIKIINDLNSQSIFIPLIDGFTIQIKNKNGFLAANKLNFTEQFVSKKKNNNLDELIEMDIKSSIEYGKIRDITLDNDNIKFIKEINYCFKFKLYVMDLILNNDSYIRKIDAYFINDRNGTFNVITLATCPFSLNNTTILLKNIDDYSSDRIIKYLEESMLLIIKNIK